MKRLILIFATFLLALPLFGQNSWRFSPSYTFDAPAFSKSDLVSRAEDYRMFASREYNAPDIYQYDSKHHTSWFLFSDCSFQEGRKKIQAIVKMYVYIHPEQGKYTVSVEKCEASARVGRKDLFEFETLRSDDSCYTDKLEKAAVVQIKAFIQEQFDRLIPKIREIMENPIDGFQLQKETE
ncbi:MAG: hypothetical protein IJG35_04380 [Bacteroidales bacterium]|nr:hypothetical protein [Bacteroidales bacterium]